MRNWLAGTMPRWYAVASVVVSLLLLGGISVWYTNYSLGVADARERENDRRWCQLLDPLDKAYSSVPPASELGRLVAAAIHNLRVDYDC